MKVLVIGNGGREHAIAWKLSLSPKLTRLYVAPGNGGTASIAVNVDIPAKDIEGLLKFCKKEGIDLVVVGPEAPLTEGIVDRFRAEGLRIFGPDRYGAQLEGSKAFSKDLMRKLGIPTADFEVFDSPEKAMDDVARKGVPIVVKVDGLAGGKGVTVATSMPKAMEAIHLAMVKKVFGKAGERVVIEECLEGDEASVIAVTDGKTVRLLASSQDHKRAHDGDQGPNTGGMGSYSPAPIVSAELEKELLDKVFYPIVRDFAASGRPYTGFIFAGLMLTPKGYRVLEFNARLGDPETQVILPRLRTDLLEVLDAAASGRLADVELGWSDEDCVCVVMVAGGYPGDYETGKRISGLSEAERVPGLQVFHAGTRLDGTTLVTAGGRVLNIVGRGRGILEALSATYAAVDKVFFEGMYYRKDIAHRATRAKAAR
ncbi:MAG: Phosphoribosylamine--glycine ligase [Candidatus Omnitrophica bacterium]|nr:Phosphoribosylamine--glycine ligase [Candidatus Omnitrophota bacterium]